jgi:hypothetical protein
MKLDVLNVMDVAGCFVYIGVPCSQMLLNKIKMKENAALRVLSAMHCCLQ